MNNVTDMNITQAIEFAEEQARRLNAGINNNLLPEEGMGYVSTLKRLALELRSGETNLVNAHRIILAYLMWLDSARETFKAPPKKSPRRINLTARIDMTAKQVFGSEKLPEHFKKNPAEIFFKKGDLARAIDFGDITTKLDLTWVGYDYEPVLPANYFKRRAE